MIDLFKYLNRILFTCAIGFAGILPLQAADLEINISNIKNNNGKIQVIVFDTAEAFSASKHVQAFALVSMKALAGKQAVTLHDIPPGKYAVSLFHDENNDNQLNLTQSKIPLEGFGTSRAMSKFDEPGFDRASVILGPQSRSINIKVYYW